MFRTDQQTNLDLQLFPVARVERSVHEIFNGASTYGGRLMFDDIFRKPFSDAHKINGRVELLKYLEHGENTPKLEREALDFIEYYLKLPKVPSRYSYVDGLRKKLRYIMKPNNEYYVVRSGISYLIEVVCDLYTYAKSFDADSEDTPQILRSISQKVISCIEQTELSWALKFSDKRLSSYDIEKFDHWFRYLHKDKTRELLDVLYEMDVYLSVIRTRVQYGFTYAELSDNQGVDIQGLSHPFIENPVTNDISFDWNCNMCFITGANMAGKSTFMKAFGISVYLAHLGFPVPARRMKFSIFEGLYTTINVPDSIALGYSHFYAEVERIKQVATQLNTTSKLIVVFDELFRGTNVKDAFEASVEVIKACSVKRDSVFMFSSHIMEAAQELKSEIPHMTFKYFETILENGQLHYTYKINDGVSHDRLGMYIINREKVLELLRGSVEKQ